MTALAFADAIPFAAAVLAWRPFLEPMPYSWDFWPALLLPLCIAVAVVYKSIKCKTMREVPKEATQIALWILAGLGSAAAVLVTIVKLINYSRN